MRYTYHRAHAFIYTGGDAETVLLVLLQLRKVGSISIGLWDLEVLIF